MEGTCLRDVGRGRDNELSRSLSAKPAPGDEVWGGDQTGQLVAKLAASQSRGLWGGKLQTQRAGGGRKTSGTGGGGERKRKTDAVAAAGAKRRCRRHRKQTTGHSSL